MSVPVPVPVPLPLPVFYHRGPAHDPLASTYQYDTVTTADSSAPSTHVRITETATHVDADSGTDVQTRQTLQQTYDTVQDATTQIRAWCDEKQAQGYTSWRTHPLPQLVEYGETRFWLYGCASSRDTCPHRLHASHLSRYHPPAHQPDYPYIQQHAASAILKHAYQQLKQHIDPHDTVTLRQCWRPQVMIPTINTQQQTNVVTDTATATATATSSPSAPLSCIGGSTPLLGSASWPVCANCHAPLYFMFQLASDEMPHPLTQHMQIGGRPSVLQLFVCGSDAECGWQYWVNQTSGEAPTANCMIRCIPTPTDEHKTDASSLSPSTFTSPAADHSTGPWTSLSAPCPLVWHADPQPDVPQVHLDPVWSSLHMSTHDYIRSIKPYGLPEQVAPHIGTKLAGFPYYQQANKSQDVSIPVCPDCQTRMSYLLQVWSNDVLVPFDFGDGGVAHIYHCIQHTQQVKLVWTSHS